MKRLFMPVLTLAAAGCLLSGCVNVDYVGQSFDPIPEGTAVEYFSARKEIPAGKYRIIGRGTIETTRKLDRFDLREILVDSAREHGADAVAVVSEKQVNVGVYPQENDMISGGLSSTANAYNLNPDGTPMEMDTFGAPSRLQGGTRFRTELHVKALFLKEREALEQQLARRGTELDTLVKQPDPNTPNKFVEE